MAVGSFVGNIAKDLGLDANRLTSGRARIFTAGSSEYVELDREKAQLIVKERIDREQLCGETSACSFSFEVILENPMELYHVGGTGTLQHVYNYEVCKTTDSRKSDMKYVRPCSQSIISLDASGTQTLSHVQEKRANEDSENQGRCHLQPSAERGAVQSLHWGHHCWFPCHSDTLSCCSS
ncbi:hypothetical protein AAFF_G00322490 [Aldrovandia affinis]|uniref:Cadherin N-terminal domain-containing protein n=1 Tax=Aldrovandia affinis TaxID=143900 RepID=A0AAD7SN37_9TELE|nr:hypothetical protein AAFF_G00322490 [Aldrovandia affinis]